MDCFDVGFDDVPGTAPPKPRTYEPLPEGTHEVEIVAASVGDVPWKTSAENESGQCLRLRLSGGRDFAFVFADIPRERKWAFKALAAALGLEPGPDGRVSIGPPEGLVGRHVRVETGRYKTRAGETRANVKRWLPANGQPAAPRTRVATAPARTQSTKAAAAFRATAADDDIPF